MEHEERMLSAAELYYYEGLTQSEVSARMGVTRWTVGRLLEEAKQAGIVRIVIDHPRARRHELELKLKKAFGLRDAVVLAAQPRPADTLQSVGAAAARQLCGMQPAVRRVAVSWGRTVAAVAAELPVGWARGVEIIQTNGGPVVARGNPVGDSLYVLAEKGPGAVRSLAGPAILDSVGTARALRSEASIARTLTLAERSPVMMFSPGTVGPDSVLVQSGYLVADQITALGALGVVGDVMSHFILSDGSLADPDLDARTLSISLDALRRCPTVIAVSTGDQKKAATLAAVTAGLVTHLVTDSSIAAFLVAATSENGTDEVVLPVTQPPGKQGSVRSLSDG
jgi:deoxyribonucleoside regulator